MNTLFKTTVALFFVIIASLLSTPVEAKPVKIVGTVADASVSIDAISHVEFDTLLKKYVDTNGNVDYRTWQKEDYQTLENYLKALSAADPRLDASRDNQLAFWINAYNALTIYGILEKYPTSSIKNHTAKLFGYNIWKDLKLQVANGAFSLDSIEHKILRHMDEPRIHFAIVCASESCPRLLNEAFTGETLEDQLVTNAEHFFAQSGNFQINAKSGKVKLSSILNWFGEDFGDNKNEVLDSIEEYLTPKDSEALATKEKWSISYLPYSWKLNEQK